MLKSIKNIDTKRSLGILTFLINKSLPSPFENPENNLGTEDNRIANLVTEEVNQRIKKKLTSESNFDSAVLSELSNEIAEISLRGKDLLVLKKKVGGQGILSTALYRPVFQPNFNNEIAQYGIRKNQIEEILMRPDVIQAIGYGEGNNISLYLKNIESRSSVSQVMVFVQRYEDTLIIHNAWRYYSNELKYNGTEAINSFVLKYGLNIKLNNDVKILFSNYEMPLTKDVLNNNVLTFQVLGDGVKNFTAASNYRADEVEKKLLISYLFAINNEKYFEDLRAFQNL